jgi:hypothetical protein
VERTLIVAQKLLIDAATRRQRNRERYRFSEGWVSHPDHPGANIGWSVSDPQQTKRLALREKTAGCNLS